MKKKLAALRQSRGKQIELMEANVTCSNEQQTKAYTDAKAEVVRLDAEIAELEQIVSQPPAPAGAPAAEPDAANLAAENAELSRKLQITTLGTKYGLATLAGEHIDKKSTVEQFRAALLDGIAAREIESRNQITVSRDEGDTRIAGYREALLARAGLLTLTDKHPGFQYRGRVNRQGAFLRMLEDCVRAHGKNPDHMSQDAVIHFAMHSTSDLPLILGTTSDASLRAGYAKAPNEWRLIGARRTANNFRPQFELQLDMTATFPQVPESGEYQSGTLVEGRETWRVFTYANKISVTRQVIINDDLGAITNVPERLGIKAGIREAALFWANVIGNPALADLQNVFSAAHLNVVNPGTVINVANLDIAFRLMAAQTDLGGDNIVAVPKYLVVPPARRQLALQYMSQAFNPQTPANINTEAGTMQVIVEQRLAAAAGGSDTAWMEFADPNIAPVFVYAYLLGNEGVFSQSEQTIDVDGFKWLARFDFGVGAIDYRGAVMNLGA